MPVFDPPENETARLARMVFRVALGFPLLVAGVVLAAEFFDITPALDRGLEPVVPALGAGLTLSFGCRVVCPILRRRSRRRSPSVR